MAIRLDVVTLGAIIGLGYGLVAVGLILAYRASRVVNLAHGQIGAFAALVLALLVQDWSAPYWLALPLALAVGAALGAIVELGIVRRLRDVPPLVTLVATLGVGEALLFAGLALAEGLPPGEPFPQPPGLPSFDIGALRVTPASFALLAGGPLVVLAIGALLRRTTLGVAIRASAANSDAARLLGVRAPRMATISWTLAGALAAFTAVFVLPASGTADAQTLGPALLLRALAAAAIGGMTNLPVALAAGIGVGVVEQLALWNVPEERLTEPILFAAILLALALRPTAAGRLAERGSWLAFARWRPLPQREAAALRPLTRALWFAAIAAAAALPLLLSAPEELRLAQVAAYAVVGLSVWVVTALAGELSLGQFAIAGIGLLAMIEVSQATGAPAAGVVAAPVAGALAAGAVALPALRSRGLALTVATLGLALASHAWLFEQDWAFGTGEPPPRLDLGIGSTDEPALAYLLGLAVIVACVAGLRVLALGRFGRALVAARDNDPAARALGIPARRARLRALMLAGAIAGLGGVLLGQGLFEATAGAFPSDAGIDVVAMAVVGGLAVAAGPVIGALYIVALPTFVSLDSAALAATALGWLLLLLYVPGGLAALVEPLRERLAALLREEGRTTRAPARPTVEEPDPLTRALERMEDATETERGGPAVALSLEGLEKRYRGVRAVEAASLQVHAGEAVGVIGPNGAGKTTLLDLATGLAPPDAGRVVLLGRDVTRLSTERRAIAGLVRSFEDASLFPTMTAGEVVRLAVAVRPSGVRREEHATALVELFGLDPYARNRVAELSTGTRRILELACVLALEPRVMLLDEPSAGLAQREVEALATLLRRLRARTGAAMLVVDHDLALVRAVCDRVIAMSAGRVVADGPPEAVLEDPRVWDAYGAGLARAGGHEPPAVELPR